MGWMREHDYAYTHSDTLLYVINLHDSTADPYILIAHAFIFTLRTTVCTCGRTQFQTSLFNRINHNAVRSVLIKTTRLRILQSYNGVNRVVRGISSAVSFVFENCRMLTTYLADDPVRGIAEQFDFAIPRC